ncbi:MAG: DUF3168 domain-containing protein [Caulobacteraceae bacterium]|nr:DUF3168 domain-containing protein [Caulobacteraceae bacterium]
MSAIGLALRTYLSGRAGYSATIPGGISPEVAGVGSSMPYAVYQLTSATPQMQLSGTPAVRTERVQVTVVSTTRASAAVVGDWIRAQIIASPGRQTIGSTLVHHWRVEDVSHLAEVVGDGDDEPLRVTVLDVHGTYQES